MNASLDEPLDIPPRTLVALDRANRAARQTRQTVETSRAGIWAGIGMGVVGLGGFTSVDEAALPDAAKWIVAGAGLLLGLGGTVLMYVCLWKWIRRGRYDSLQSPLSDSCAKQGGRGRLKMVIAAFTGVFIQALAFQFLRGRIPDTAYYGMLIWGTRLVAVGIVVLFIYRFSHSGFWEYLVFSFGTAGTLGLYIFAKPLFGADSPVPACIAAISIVAATVAAWSLIVRLRNWNRTVDVTGTTGDLASGESS